MRYLSKGGKLCVECCLSDIDSVWQSHLSINRIATLYSEDHITSTLQVEHIYINGRIALLQPLYKQKNFPSKSEYTLFRLIIAQWERT